MGSQRHPKPPLPRKHLLPLLSPTAIHPPTGDHQARGAASRRARLAAAQTYRCARRRGASQGADTLV